MARRGTGTRNELIRCESCGEEYSVTYRRCPFCGGKGRQNASQEDTFVFEGGYIFDEIDREKADGTSRSGDTGRDTGRSSASRGGKRAAGAAPPAPSSRSGPATRSSSATRSGSTSRSSSAARSGSSARSRRPEDEEPDPEWVIILREFWDRTGLTPARLAVLLGTLAVIIAAFVIVIQLILPDDGEDPQGSGSPDPGHSQTGDPSPSGSDPGGSDPGTSGPGTSDPGTSDPGTSDPGSSDSPDPSPTVSQPTVRFTLDKSEFTISDRWPSPVKINAVFDPAAAAETVTWTSSDPSVATVDQTGLVTAVARGSTTITAAIPSGATQTCKVYVTITDGSDDPEPSGDPDPSIDPDPSPSPAETLTLSSSEFTISDQWPDPVTLRAEGAVGAVTWTSSDPAVATVDANGKVTRVGEGRCTITATDEAGNTAECIVRCNFD